MKTPEEMREFFRSMPSKKKENPYWDFDEDTQAITARLMSITPGVGEKPFLLDSSAATLRMVREFFRRFYEAFTTEGQVLCVTREDGQKLNGMGIPVLGYGNIGPYAVTVLVLPQDNHTGLSVLSEAQWQNMIVGQGITPVLRIHSHHVLEPYQSSVDYSTLNSNTLEMVIGRIFEEDLNICFWLDKIGTDQKAQTFVARENKDGTFTVEPRVFHKPVVENPFENAKVIHGAGTPEESEGDTGITG